MFLPEKLHHRDWSRTVNNCLDFSVSRMERGFGPVVSVWHDQLGWFPPSLDVLEKYFTDRLGLGDSVLVSGPEECYMTFRPTSRGPLHPEMIPVSIRVYFEPEYFGH